MKRDLESVEDSLGLLDQYSQQFPHVPETAKTEETGLQLWNGMDMRQSERTRWLAQGHLPLGQVSVLIGDEGIGKSLWWVLMVAHITTGSGDDRLGISPTHPRDVVLVLTEDAWATEVRPRLEAAGVDLSRVHVWAEQDDGSGSVCFPRDQARFLQALVGVDAALIVVDAWLDTVPAGLQVKDPHQARQALHPWKAVAESTGACVLLIAHTNRSDADRLRNRVGATVALRQKARMVLYAARPPHDDTLLYVGVDKANGTALGNAISYRLNVQQVRSPMPDDPGTIANLQVIGDTGATMEQHNSRWLADARPVNQPNADERAWNWLRGFMIECGTERERDWQVPAQAAKQAAEIEGHNPQRLAQVVRAHGGNLGPDGVGGPWNYRLPKTVLELDPESSNQFPQSSQSSQSQQNGESVTKCALPDCRHPRAAGRATCTIHARSGDTM